MADIKNNNLSIVMLANDHPAFDTRIFQKEARTLIHAGFSVSIIVQHDHDDLRDGIPIIAVPVAKGGFKKLVTSPWNILRKAIHQPKTSIFHLHDSDILLVGIILKILGRKVIYDAHEDTPLQISYQHWLPAFAKTPYAWFYYGLEWLSGLLFDRIIVAEPVIAKYFPKHKTLLIRNFPILDSFTSTTPNAYTLRKKRLTSIGSLTVARGLFEMLEGAKAASQIVDFEFTLGGSFSPATLEKQVKDNYTVNFLAQLPFAKVVNILFDSRIGIIVPHPIKRYQTNYPVKLFEFMAAALPVIASRDSEAAKFVTEAQCGILVDPLNVSEISQAIIWLFQNTEEAEAMGKRGQELVLKKYNWENESQVLLRVYNSLV